VFLFLETVVACSEEPVANSKTNPIIFPSQCCLFKVISYALEMSEEAAPTSCTPSDENPNELCSLAHSNLAVKAKKHDIRDKPERSCSLRCFEMLKVLFDWELLITSEI